MFQELQKFLVQRFIKQVLFQHRAIHADFGLYRPNYSYNYPLPGMHQLTGFSVSSTGSITGQPPYSLSPISGTRW